MFFLKKFKFLIIMGAVGVILLYIFLKPDKQAKIETVIARRGEIKQEVSVVGNVKPAEDVDLAFELGGKIKKTYVAIGDKVESGQKLAELSNNDYLADLRQAQAQVSGAQSGQ